MSRGLVGAAIGALVLTGNLIIETIADDYDRPAAAPKKIEPESESLRVRLLRQAQMMKEARRASAAARAEANRNPWHRHNEE